jgi:hypothetical protein
MVRRRVNAIRHPDTRAYVFFPPYLTLCRCSLYQFSPLSKFLEKRFEYEVIFGEENFSHIYIFFLNQLFHDENLMGDFVTIRNFYFYPKRLCD